MELAYEKTIGLLLKHPDLARLFSAGGGSISPKQVIVALSKLDQLFYVLSELTCHTRNDLRQGIVNVVISSDISEVAYITVDMSLTVKQNSDNKRNAFLHFSLCTSEDI